MLSFTMLSLYTGCKPTVETGTTEEETVTAEETTAEITAEAGTTTETITELETTTAAPAPETTTAAPELETTTAETVPKIPRASAADINPLTGHVSDVNLSGKRPVAVMVNNLRVSLPQSGISEADIIYECLVEGGTTRLLAVFMNYEKVGVIGSVRSSRDYYLDLAQNHDAIYVHAGGSPLAYDNIQSRKINNLDGVNMYVPNMFYRDAVRRQTMAMEHTLMTTGEKITAGIAYMKYRTEIKSGFENPFNFIDYRYRRKIVSGSDAKHVIVTYNSAQFPQYIYQPMSNTYLRYQYNGIAHVDAGNNNKQLEFTNLLLVVCPHGDLNDEKGRIGINMVGTGTAYYVYGGKYEKLTWSKKTRDSAISFVSADGTPLIMNCGKTAVNVISPDVEKGLVFNYTKK
jgi:hypothetical protein